jgi:hypothetical protein
MEIPFISCLTLHVFCSDNNHLHLVELLPSSPNLREGDILIAARQSIALRAAY